MLPQLQEGVLNDVISIIFISQVLENEIVEPIRVGLYDGIVLLASQVQL